MALNLPSLLKIVAYSSLTLIYVTIANDYAQKKRERESWLFSGIALSMLTITAVAVYNTKYVR